MAKRVILIVPDGADSLLSILDKYMKEWVHANAAKEPEGKDGHKDDHPTGLGEAKHADKGTYSRAPTPTAGLEVAKKRGSKDDTHMMTDNSSETITVKSNLSASSMSGLLGDKTGMKHNLSANSLTNLLEKPTASANKSTMSTLFRKISLISGTQDSATHDMIRASYPAKAYVNSKTAQANANDLPFEMHAFEALLTTVMALETQEYNKVNTQVQVILGYFRSGMLSYFFPFCNTIYLHFVSFSFIKSGSLLPIEIQEKMRNRKNDLSVMMRRISSAR